MKKIILLFMVTAIMASCQETLEERAAREARDYTEKHCPAPIAHQVTMDSMTFDKATHTFGYYYTLSGTLDDSAYIRRNNPYEMLLQQVKNSTYLKIYKDEDYNFRYIYNSQKHKGTVLFDETFKSKDYK